MGLGYGHALSQSYEVCCNEGAGCFLILRQRHLNELSIRKRHDKLCAELVREAAQDARGRSEGGSIEV